MRPTVGALAAMLLTSGWLARPTPRAGLLAPSHQAKAGHSLARHECVVCHAFPPPDILPRASWHGELEKMAVIVRGGGVASWGEPPPPVVLSDDEQAILAYYEREAPLALPTPEPWPAVDDPPRFVRRLIPFPDALGVEPAVSNVHLVDLEGDGRLDPRASAIPIAQVPHPAHVAVADMDGDGRRDLLVADLGEFYPGDHEKGAATILRSLPGGGYAAFTIGGLPRVADVEAGDFDGDGRLDLVAAAFGWHRTGEIDVCLNRTQDWRRPSFERVKVDGRPGAIHVIPTDLDGDGKLDFVALLSQEHEAVVAFLGDGAGGFRAHTLYAAPHPNWGSSGIELVDLDQDGDLDVLMTNGDMFDDDILKPYHGIQWLENKGGLHFQPHPLARLPGAYRAVAADLDSDGDLDIVAAAFTGMAGSSGPPLPSLVWLEQVQGGRFERHTIATGHPLYATLDVGDVDGDGDIDVVTGLFHLHSPADHWLEVWENRGAAPAGRPR